MEDMEARKMWEWRFWKLRGCGIMKAVVARKMWELRGCGMGTWRMWEHGGCEFMEDVGACMTYEWEGCQSMDDVGTYMENMGAWRLKYLFKFIIIKYNLVPHCPYILMKVRAEEEFFILCKPKDEY
jgi:hypothetical protein